MSYKTPWKTKICYAEDVLKTSWVHVLKTSWRRLEDQPMFAGQWIVCWSYIAKDILFCNCFFLICWNDYSVSEALFQTRPRILVLLELFEINFKLSERNCLTQVSSSLLLLSDFSSNDIFECHLCKLKPSLANSSIDFCLIISTSL